MFEPKTIIINLWRVYFAIAVGMLVGGGLSISTYYMFISNPVNNRWLYFLVLFCFALGLLSWLLAKVFYPIIHQPIFALVKNISNELTEHESFFPITNEHKYLLNGVRYAFEQLLDQSNAYQKLLTESELSYSTILDTQNEFVLKLGEDGFVNYSNRAFANFFSSSTSSPETDSHINDDPFIENFTLSAVVLQVIDDVRSTMEIAKLTLQDQFVESTVVINNKQYFIGWQIKYIASNVSVSIAGLDAQYLLVGRDDTKTKTIEQRNRQIESLATVGRVASTISHEINQPLSVIQLLANNLLDMCQHDQINLFAIEQKLEKIMSQTERADKIISELKAFNSNTQRSTYSADFDIYVLMSIIYEEQKPLAQKQCIELYYCSPTNTSGEYIAVYGSETMFGQALHNMINNSIFALNELNHDKKSKIIIIKCGHENNNFYISILDNGPGVEKDLLEKIATPFFSTKPPELGSGIGLALSYDIIYKMGGTLTFCNRSTGGFQVDIVLPCKYTFNADENKSG